MRRFTLIFCILSLALTSLAVGAEIDSGEAICHVCRVHEGESEPEKVVATVEHDGQTFGFCSPGCRDRFLKAPELYLPPVLPRPAPPFEALDLEGKPFSSTELEGRIVLLDFWATWCQPCVVELPGLSRLHERYAERGVTVVGLSIDEGKKAARKVSRILERKKATHPVYLDATDSPAWAAYRVAAVPAQFLIDADGKIVAQWSGTIELEQIETAILELLAKAETPDQAGR